MTHQSYSVEQTEAVAAQLARTLVGGECIALYGELGSGKTQFVRGIVRGLGGDAHTVSSPTFVLLNVYDAPRLRVYHFDAYRVSGADDFELIGFAEILEQRGVVVIEWADRVKALLPASRIDVRIIPTSESTRRIEISFQNPAGAPPPRGSHAAS